MSSNWNRADRERAADPQPGDLWSEMLAYWHWVEARDGDTVTLRIGPGGQHLSDLPQSTHTVEEFQRLLRWSHYARNTELGREGS